MDLHISALTWGILLASFQLGSYVPRTQLVANFRPCVWSGHPNIFHRCLEANPPYRPHRRRKALVCEHVVQQTGVSEDRAYSANHLQGAVAKTKKATNILRPAIDVTFDKDAEFEVFSEVGVQEVRFFFIFSSSAGGRIIKSR